MGLFSSAYNRISGFAKAHPTATVATAAATPFLAAALYVHHRDAPARRAIADLTDYSARLTAARTSGLPPSQWPRT